MRPSAQLQTSLQTSTYGCHVVCTGARVREANLVEASFPLEGEASSPLQANARRCRSVVSEQRLPFHLWNLAHQSTRGGQQTGN